MASILLLSSLFSTFLFAQDNAIGMDEDAIAENQLRIDAFEYYSIHPINLRESLDELRIIPGIPTSLIQSCKRILNDHPLMDDIQDLIALLPSTLDTSVIHILLHCTNLKPKQLWSASLRTRMSISNPLPRGFEQQVFQGSSESFMQRLFIGNNTLKAALIFGKHSGEQYRHGMLHGSISYSTSNWTIIAGDHSVQIGLGTLFSSGISMPNMAKPTQRAEHWSTAIRPYTSLIEHPNFRGVSVQYRMKNILAGLSLATRNRYAYRNDEGALTGFPGITYARTNTELQYRAGVKEQRIALFTEIKQYSHQFSISTFYQYYQSKIAQTAFAIGEQEQFLASLDYRFTNNHITVSAGSLIDKRYNIGGIFMIHHDADKQQQAFIMRYHDPELRSPLGNSPGRFTIPNNEIGMQVLLSGRIHSMQYASSVDLYSNIVIPHNKKTIQRGMRTALQLSKENGQFLMLCRVIHQLESSKEMTAEYDSFWRCRVDFAYKSKKMLSICRVESHINTQTETDMMGIGCSLEIKSQKQEFHPWNWSFRIAWANTDAFASAIYLPESGLPGQLLIDPLYGIMTMLGIKVGYQFPNVNCSLLLRQRHKPREDFLGSGWMQVRGNMEMECHFQADITL